MRGIFGVAILAAVLPAAPIEAQEVAPYEPLRGQSGKDVVWIPTPDGLVTRMLKLAQVKPGDFVVDLGAGDGKIVIAAARDFQARALGLEYDGKLVAHARLNAKGAGVSKRAEFRQADIFAADFSNADVVTMYLLPDLNLRLRHTLLAMKPGTRVVSHQFSMGKWLPDETSWVQNRPAYLWIVPANAGGTWQASYPESGSTIPSELTLDQKFQKVTGTLEFAGIRTALRNPQVQGSRISFGFTDAAGNIRHVDGTISGDRMQGVISGRTEEVAFTAQRRGAMPPVGGAAPASAEEVIAEAWQVGE